VINAAAFAGLLVINQLAVAVGLADRSARPHAIAHQA